MILIDYRTGSAELCQYFTDPKAPAIVAPVPGLLYGDFQFPGNGPNGPVMIGVERKALKDALGCIQTGRYASEGEGQLPGMMRTYDVWYLIIEGVYRADAQGILQEPDGRGGWRDVTTGSTRWDLQTLECWLTSLEIQSGVRVRQTPNKLRTAQAVTYMYRTWSKPYDGHSSMKIFTDLQTGISLTPPSLVRRVAKELAGIGWERSKAIDERWRTVYDMVTADIGEWRGLKGIKALGTAAWHELRGLTGLVK